MAVKTLYLTNALVDGWAELSETSPGTAALSSPVTGWIVGKIAAGNYASFDSGVERTTAGFTATVQPDGSLDTTLDDAWRAGPYSGDFANTAWTIQAQLQSTTAVTATNAINLRFRVFRSPNIDGSGATEITSSTLLVPASTFYSLTTTGSAVTNSNTWSPGALTLDSEYLFFQVACYINAASGSNSSDVNFRVGTGATLVTTPDFTATNRDVTITGVSAAFTKGNESVGMTTGLTISGVSAAFTQGNESASQLVVQTIAGNTAASTVGTVTRNMSTGTSISAVSTGSLVSSFTNAASTANASLTGVSNVSTTVGTVSRSMSAGPTLSSVSIVPTINTGVPGITKTITGVSNTSTSNTSIIPSMSISKTLSSVALNYTFGTFSALPTANKSITGNSTTVTQGTLPQIRLGVTFIGISALISQGSTTGANYKGATLTGRTAVVTKGTFTYYKSISISGVKAKGRASKFRFWSPSNWVFTCNTLTPTFETNNRTPIFESSVKFQTLEASDKYNRFTTDRIRVFLSTRPNYYN